MPRTARVPAKTFSSLPILRILLRRPTNPLADLRILRALLLYALRNQLETELPVVAVVEQERHLVADLREGLGDARPLDAAGVARFSNIIHVGEQLIFNGRVEDVSGQLAVEAERVIEIEAEGCNDRGGEIVKLLATRNFDVPIELRV
jgi:hypothetical protein